MKRSGILFVGIGLVSLAALAQTKTAEMPPARKNAAPAIGNVSAEFQAGANGKDAGRIAATYEENAVLMPPNGPAVHGRDNIRTFWQGLIDGGARDISLVVTGSSQSGAVAYEAGTYAFTMQPAGGAASRDQGKFLTGLRCGKDGTWRLAYDIFNSDLPCPPAAAAAK